MNNITHIDILNYCKNLVENSVYIDESNFYRMDIAEIQGAMKTGIGFPAFALESHEGDFEGSSTNNTVENKTFAFTILKKPTQGNFNEQNQYLDDCEVIGKKFLARMRRDSRDESTPIYNLFDANLVKYHKVGPIYIDMCFGYRFEVALKPQKANLKVDANDWEDLETEC